MTEYLMYAILLAWVALIINRALDFLIVRVKWVKPKLKETEHALDKTPRILSQVCINILESKKLYPKKPNVFGVYDKKVYFIHFPTILEQLDKLIMEGKAEKVKIDVTAERAEKIGKPKETAYVLKQHLT